MQGAPHHRKASIAERSSFGEAGGAHIWRFYTGEGPYSRCMKEHLSDRINLHGDVHYTDGWRIAWGGYVV